MPEIPWTESRVLSTHVYQDDTDRFELTILEHPTRGTEVEYQVTEEWRPLTTPSVLHHRTLYRGRSLAAAHDARDREMSYIHETKRRGGRLVMRARAKNACAATMRDHLSELGWSGGPYTQTQQDRDFREGRA